MVYLLNYWKAEIFNTTTSNLRKNLSEDDCESLQISYIFEILYIISKNVNFFTDSK